jgi:hypothetical protein
MHLKIYRQNKTTEYQFSKSETLSSNPSNHKETIKDSVDLKNESGT